MPALSDCLPGVLVTVFPKGFMYLADSAAPQVNAGMLETAERMSVPDGVNVFVSRDTALDPAFRRYLDQLDPRARATHVVTVLDPETLQPVTDPETLRSVAAGLDLPVSTVEPIAGEDIVPVDVAGRVTALEMAGYRVLPPNAMAQRAALLDAVSLSGTPSSIQEGLERLTGWHERVALTRTQLGLPTNPGDLAHTGPGEHATTYALGAYVARYGGDGVFDLLTSTEPLTSNRVATAIGGTLTSVRPTTLASVLSRSPGSSALVTGTAVGASTEQVFWLTSDENGTLTWHDPRAAVGTQVFDIDGGNDWRTAVLERDDARAMLVGPDGIPVALPEPGPAVVGPRNHEVTYVGDWPPKNLDRYGLNSVDFEGMPVIAVDVRVHPGEGRPLDPKQFVEIRSRLERYYLNNVRPTVVATRQHEEIENLARTFEAAVVQQVVQVGIEGRPGWQVIRPDAVPRTFDGAAVTRAMLDVADLSSMTAREPLPPVLAEFLSHDSYQQAADHLTDHADQLRDPAVLTAARDLADRFPEDRRLQGLELALRVAARAPLLAGAEPVEPALVQIFDEQPSWPTGRPVDARFVFDYLTASTQWQGELAPSTGTQTRETHTNRMTWDSLLFQGMLDSAIDPAEAIALVRAVGESNKQRADRAADGGKEVAQAHASIFEAVKLLLSGDRVAGSNDWREVLSVECLTGADRVPWHFRFKQLLDSKRLDGTPGLADEIRGLTAQILTCH
ncbi:hypothetical protein ACFYL6_20220 [Micromonospora sp. NPDC007208]|uniref:hypothetical protein n=1 Tax=Micromonospora sp. NPDC007208 TaxID=3364236 RepID=UPI00367AA991